MTLIDPGFEVAEIFTGLKAIDLTARKKAVKAAEKALANGTAAAEAVSKAVAPKQSVPAPAEPVEDVQAEEPAVDPDPEQTGPVAAWATRKLHIMWRSRVSQSRLDLLEGNRSDFGTPSAPALQTPFSEGAVRYRALGESIRIMIDAAKPRYRSEDPTEKNVQHRRGVDALMEKLFQLEELPEGEKCEGPFFDHWNMFCLDGDK